MTYTRTSLILGDSPVTVGPIMAWAMRQGAARTAELRSYLDTLVLHARALGMDPLVLIAQSDLETDTWRSEPWRTGLNMAGLGMTMPGGYPANPNAQQWLTGQLAALAHVAHMAAYVWGEDWNAHWPDAWDPPSTYDHRFGLAVRTGNLADELQDLHGTWAIEPNPREHYGDKIAERANRLLSIIGDEVSVVQGDDDMPENIFYGNVPKPRVKEQHLNYANHPMIGYSPAPIVVEGVVWHRMIGSLWGTDSWFKAGKAATEYGVGVGSVDGAGNAGTILEWIDPANGHYFGHSSGPVSNPYGDGKRFVDRFGVGRVNPQTVAIEISGDYDTPLDQAARGAIIQLTAYFADQRGIPWHDFPIVPGQARSFVHWHTEFTRGTGKICPGNVVMGETSELIRRTAEYMRGYQEMTQPPKVEYPKPSPVAEGTQRLGDYLFLAPGAKTVTRDQAPLMWGDAELGKPTGPPIPMGTRLSQEQLSHYVIGSDGEMYVVLEDVEVDGIDVSGSRFPADAFVEVN